MKTICGMCGVGCGLAALRAVVKAMVTEHIREDVVQVTHGWPGDGNVDLLIDNIIRDEISGFHAFKSKRCKIVKWDK